MNNLVRIVGLGIGGAALLGTVACSGTPQLAVQPGTQEQQAQDETIKLPAPRRKGTATLEAVLARRRSVRKFAAKPLTRAAIGQLLWSAQGITNENGYRTAPSAGALYPLELYVVTAEGVCRYEPVKHRLRRITKKDVRRQLFAAALRQTAVRDAPALVVVTAVYERTQRKYGERRGPRYVQLEAGHAAQNLLLQATTLGLGAVPIGAFTDDAVRRALGAPADHRPLYVIPVGHPAKSR